MKTIYIVTITDLVSAVGSRPNEDNYYFQDELAAQCYVDGFEAAGSKTQTISMREESYYDQRTK